MSEPIIQTIEGQRTLVVRPDTNLPKAMPDLLRAMAPFGFSYRDDFPLGGTRRACEVARAHRFRKFRQGRWWNPSPFSVIIGRGLDDAGQPELKMTTVTAGTRELRLDMCQDCGAVCVRDISLTGYAGARPARIRNDQTGEVRVAPAVGRRDLIIGWYSGQRRNGREYK